MTSTYADRHTFWKYLHDLFLILSYLKNDFENYISLIKNLLFLILNINGYCGYVRVYCMDVKTET